MSGPDAAATPFIGSDRRSELLNRLAARAQSTPPATTPEAIASRVAASVRRQMMKRPRETCEDIEDEERKATGPRATRTF